MSELSGWYVLFSGQLSAGLSNLSDLSGQTLRGARNAFALGHENQINVLKIACRNSGCGFPRVREWPLSQLRISICVVCTL